MAGPVPTYLTTQTTAQSAFTVPFGLLSLVNTSISTAVAAGEFNVTVDCSLFVIEDVSNLRIYLDSLGYDVDFAKNTNDKSLNIDWGKFVSETSSGGSTVVTQGTIPWVVAGTVDQGVAGAESWLVDVTNTVDVVVTNFPATQPISGTVTALQGTSPWVVTGTISTSPDVNVHDGAGVSIGSTGDSLHVAVSNFPATQNVAIISSVEVEVKNDTGSPVPVSGTVTANAGTGPFPVSDNGGSLTVDGVVTATQSGAWTVAGTGDFTVVQPTGTNLHTVLDSGTLTGITNALPAGTNVIGHVIADSGSTTAVTGNVTVVQATGTNLHAVIDSGTIATSNSATSASTATWTSATAQDTVVSVATTGFGTVLLTTRITGSITAGLMSYEASDDSGSHWYALNLVRMVNGTGIVSFTLALAGEIGYSFFGTCSGFTNVRVRLSTAISGSGTLNLQLQAFAAPSPLMTIVSQANANSLRTQLSDGSNNSVLTSAGALTTADVNITKSFGTWVYYAGSSGTVNVTAGQRVIGISAHATTAGSLTINGGATVTIPAGASFNLEPLGNLTAPTVIFTSTDAYFIEVVS